MANKKDLLMKALEQLREEVLVERDYAANPPPYMDEEDYASYTGKELAYDDVVYKLNKIIKEYK